MNDKSKKSKKFKTQITSFGDMLKKAIAKPTGENNKISESQLPDKDSGIKQVSKEILSAKSKTRDIKNNTNLKFKLGDIKPKNLKEKQNVHSRNIIEDNSEDILSLFSDVAKPQILRRKNDELPTPIKSKNDPKSNEVQDVIQPKKDDKYAKIMRQKFWQNLEGENPGGHRSRALRINLGIDLGTSFSKVAYRLGSESFPVQFGANKNKVEDYLVPSVVAIGGKLIRCQFDFEDETKLNKVALIPNFKICLTCEKKEGEADCSITKCDLSNLRQNYLPKEISGEEASFLTAFYLAKLISKTKSAVRTNLRDREIPSDISIKWSANMAVPDKYLDSKLIEGFREALEIGWLMAEIFLAHPNFLNKTEMIVCFQAAKKLRSEIKVELHLKDKDFDCFTYSEIGAEVASVTLSPTSEEGLYVLVDVGAGTVDTSVFRFRRSNGEVIQETYASNIFKLGAAHIDARANASFRRKSMNWLRQIKENILNLNSNEVLIHITEEIKSAEQNVTAELREKLVTVFREAFNKHKDVNVWSDLKLIMGGGGSSIESYGQTALETFSIQKRDSKFIKTSELKIPGDFQMGTIPNKSFHRFAVAYGLSRDLIELPELVPASEIGEMKVLRQKVYIDPTNDG